MKIRLVGAELFHADGQTGMTKLTVAFRSFAKAPKKEMFRLLFRVVTLSSHVDEHTASVLTDQRLDPSLTSTCLHSVITEPII